MNLFQSIFPPPPMPVLDLSLIERVPAVKVAITQAIVLFYYQGMLDGMLLGSLLTLMVTSSIRRVSTRAQP